jgi:hypothetical protein
MSKAKQWDRVIDGDPVDKIDRQREVIVELNIKLDRANDENASLKNLLAECARALWQPRNYTSQQMLDLIERARKTSL